MFLHMTSNISTLIQNVYIYNVYKYEYMFYNIKIKIHIQKYIFKNLVHIKIVRYDKQVVIFPFDTLGN